MIGRANPRKQQQLGRQESAGAQNDLAFGFHLHGLTLAHIFHTAGARAAEEDARDFGFGLHRQVGPLHGRRQVRRGRAGAIALLVHMELQVTSPILLARAVVVPVRAVIAQFGRADLEGFRAHRGVRAVTNLERTAYAVIFGCAALVILDAFVIGQHIIETPAIRAHRVPLIVVAAITAHIHHGVDRGAAANHATLIDDDLAPTHALLRLGGKLPIIIGSPQRNEPAQFVDARMSIHGAGFQNQNLQGRIGAQPIGNDTPTSPSAYYDIIVFFCSHVSILLQTVHLGANPVTGAQATATRRAGFTPSAE